MAEDDITMSLISPDSGSGPQRTSKRSRGGGDDDGYANSIRWFKKGDPRNREIMRDLKVNNNRAYKRVLMDTWEKRKFPYKDFGKMHLRRGQEYTLSKYGTTWTDANPTQREARDVDGWIGRGKYKPITWKQFVGGVKDVGHLIGKPILSGFEDLAVKGLAGMGKFYHPQMKTIDYPESPNIMSYQSMGNLGGVGFQMENANQLIGRSRPSIGMDVTLDETNSITITHSEYIQDITPTSTSFQNVVFLNINPGLGSTFPWLSNIAQFYEEYEFEQLVFSFKSMVTEGNSNASGNVIMATQYNPTNGPFTSKQVMENYDYANSCKVTADAHHGLECDPTKHGGSQIEYIRTGPITGNQDLKTYDLATFQLATNGAYYVAGSPPTTITLGELWVHYKVKLRKSKIPMIGQVTRINSVAMNVVKTSGGVNSFFTNSTIVTNIDGYTATGNVLTLPAYIKAGSYQIVFYATISGITGNVGAPTVTIGNDQGTLTSLYSFGGSSTNVIVVYSASFNNTFSTGVTLTLGGMSSGTGTLAFTDARMLINQITSV